MATHSLHSEQNTFYFITFTCYKWLPLFEKADCYNAVYKWFDYLKREYCQIFGYVIMPNHLHLLLHISENSKGLNKLVANGKRFLAYEIIKKLNAVNELAILNILAAGVQLKERSKGKKHQVFRLSFDAKEITTEKSLIEILDYIHYNPVQKKWRLVDDYVEYPHSSATFYEKNHEGIYEVSHYKD